MTNQKPPTANSSHRQSFITVLLLTLRTVRRSFSVRQATLYYILITVAVITLVAALQFWNRGNMVTIAAPGGELTEGVIGFPRFVNPVLALSDVDRDLSRLTYSGLLRLGENGELVPDLAASSTISSDGLIYTLTIRPEATFQDGRPITSADVLHTVNRIKDPVVKSPRRANFEGVTVSAPDEHTIVFTLHQKYSGFNENLTIGILPAHLWQGISSELFAFSILNLEPIGSGPYRLTRVKRGSDGQPIYYEMGPFANYMLGAPRVSKLTLRFYANEEAVAQAFMRNEVESIGGISPSLAQGLKESGLLGEGESSLIESAPLPRIFAIFLNQTQQKLLGESAVREALDRAIDKELIVNEIFYGYASTLEGPVPPGSIGYIHRESEKAESERVPEEEPDRILQAQSILQKAGWSINEESGIFERTKNKQTEELRFNLATVNTPELSAVAQLIATEWRRAGIGAEVVTFDLADIQQNLIRPRKYDALLFGAIVGRQPDLFSFWHSSQRNDPGLNIALYTNVQSDKLLDRLRTESEPQARAEAIKEFDTIIRSERPAIFVYSPLYLYAIPKRLKGLSLSAMAAPTDRFHNVHEWYIEEERVWPFFVK